MTICAATYQELPLVSDLAYRIWPIAYAEILKKEQLDYMLELIYSQDALEKQVLNKHHFLLIKEDNDVIGFASYELNNENSDKTKIHKLYVLPQIQGKGVGKKIVNHIKNIAASNNNNVLTLNVNKFNNAKDFYLKIGFKIIKSIVIDIGNNYVMDDYIMELNL